MVASDHKPVVKLFADKALDDIQKPRLFCIKQRTLMWQFRIVHVPRSSHVAAARRSADVLTAVTWERVRDCTIRDENLQLLKTHIQSGFPSFRDDLPHTLQPFWQHRDKLSTIDEVVMMGDRILIPQTLRAEVLRALHSAHQGTSRMTSRAQGAVF